MEKGVVIFTGHGSPMNAIGDNKARKGWQDLGKSLPKPKVIIAISAHWTTDKLYVRRANDNPQVFDMYGFPQELYEVKYEPTSSIEYADKVLDLLKGKAEINNEWGIDHGIWSILANMYPEADIPVVMISTNIDADPQLQFEVGEKLKSLRQEGATIFASGNVVHNLRMVDWDNQNGYKWADIFDETIKQAILNRNFDKPINFKAIENYELAIPSLEHYYPLLSALGAVEEDDKITVFNDYRELGSMSMTSYLFKNN